MTIGIGHAWNRVKLEDNWYTLDPTSNDNDQLANAFFNLPDQAANLCLMEDKQYIIDNYYDKLHGFNASHTTRF